MVDPDSKGYCYINPQCSTALVPGNHEPMTREMCCILAGAKSWGIQGAGGGEGAFCEDCDEYRMTMDNPVGKSYSPSYNWEPRVVIITTLLSLEAPEVVITVSGSTSDDKVAIMATLALQCCYILASIDCTETTARRDENGVLGFGATYVRDLTALLIVRPITKKHTQYSHDPIGETYNTSLLWHPRFVIWVK